MPFGREGRPPGELIETFLPRLEKRSSAGLGRAMLAVPFQCAHYLRPAQAGLAVGAV